MREKNFPKHADAALLVSDLTSTCGALSLPATRFMRVALTFDLYNLNRMHSSWLVGYSAGLVIERLRVRILAAAAGEFSSPELTFCADSYSVSFPSP